MITRTFKKRGRNEVWGSSRFEELKEKKKKRGLKRKDFELEKDSRKEGSGE